MFTGPHAGRRDDRAPSLDALARRLVREGESVLTQVGRGAPGEDVRAVRRGGAGQRDHEAGVVLELTVGVVDGTAQGPYPRILDTGCDYAAVGSVAVLPVS